MQAQDCVDRALRHTKTSCRQNKSSSQIAQLAHRIYGSLCVTQVFTSPYAAEAAVQDAQRGDSVAPEMSSGTDQDEQALAKQQALEAMRSLRANSRSAATVETKTTWTDALVYMHELQLQAERFADWMQCVDSSPHWT